MEYTRRFPRMTVRVEVRYESSYGQHKGHATTLGAGGLFIESEEAPLPGTVLELCFRLAPERIDHHIEGQVVWRTDPSREGAHEHKPGFGVQFTDPVAAATLARELNSFGLEAESVG